MAPFAQAILRDVPEAQCLYGHLHNENPSEYRTTFTIVGENLKISSNELATEIVDANPVGLSSGIADFLADIWWIVILVALIVLFPFGLERLQRRE